MGTFSLKEKYFRFILYILVLLLINIVGVTLFFRLDLTRDKIYSLSQASIEAVETLSEPLNIKVFFSKNLPAPHNNTERYLRDLLEEYAARGGKYFNYTFYNVSAEEGLTQRTDENRDMAKDYGIQPVQIRIMENDEIKFKNAYMGLVLIHGDLIEKIEAVTSTNGLEYQLTTAIRKMNNKVSALLRLEEKVSVHMYLSSSLNTIAPLIGLDRLPELGRDITDTIARLNARNLGILDFKQFDITDKAELDAISEKYRLMALSWPAIEEKQVAAGQGAAGLVVQYKDNITSLPLIKSLELPIIGTTYQMADPDALAEELNGIVEKLVGINKDLGYLSDHGTLSLLPDRLAMMQGRQADAMQTFNSLVSANYSIKPIMLGDEGVPDGLNCLVIARPTRKFTDFELFQIDQALMKGTNIAFILDSFQEVQSSQSAMGMPPQFEPIDTGLEKLLNHYGIEIRKAYVLDKQCYRHQAPQEMGGGEQNIYFAPLLKESTINTRPEFMANIKGLIAMQISPLRLKDDRTDKDTVTATRLFWSSPESWLMEDMINLNPMFITPPESEHEMTSYDLAYLLSGTFTSYFKGKPIPEKNLGEKDLNESLSDETPSESNEAGQAGNASLPEGLTARHTFLEASRPAKILVLPCAQMIQDNMLDPEGRSTNATFILNSIDHLSSEDALALLRSKQQTLNPVAETTPFERGIIKAFNIVGLPILVILFGLGVLAKRSTRKKKIARQFNI